MLSVAGHCWLGGTGSESAVPILLSRLDKCSAALGLARSAVGVGPDCWINLDEEITGAYQTKRDG